MESVWSYLLQFRDGKEEQRLSAVLPMYRLVHWELEHDDLSIEDQLCGAFFVMAMHELANREFSASEAQIREAAKAWADSAEHCRKALASQPFGVDLVRFDPKLRDALSAAADHLQWIADSMAQKGNPRVLARGSGYSAHDRVRSHVRALASEARKLFGMQLAGIVGTTVTVGLDLPGELTDRDVRKLCANLPSPNKRSA